MHLSHWHDLGSLSSPLKIFLTIKPALQAVSCPIASPCSTPATLRPSNAMGALGKLGALGRAGVSPREKTTTLTSFTSQGYK